MAIVALVGFRAFGEAATAKAESQAACVDSFACAEGDPSASTPMLGAATPGPGTDGGQPQPSDTAPAQPEGKSAGRRIFDVGKGFVLGAWDTVTGAVHMVTHPVETVQGLWTAVTHPVETFNAIKDGLVTAWNENPEELIGRGLFEVVTAPFAAAKVSKLKMVTAVREASTTAKVVENASDAADVAAVVRRTEDASNIVEEAGLFGAARKTLADVPGGMCFVAGTLVATEHGLRAIETVAEGDLVMARDERTGATGLKRVVHTKVTPQRPVVQLELSGASGAVETVGVTDEHPFWVAGRGWVAAGELGPGSEVMSLDGGVLQVATATQLAATATVYNFEVEDAHTYFVGQSGAWVHNDCSASRVRAFTDRVKHGDFPKSMTREELRAVQANAIETVQRTFTNEFGNDSKLLEAVGAKRGAFDDDIARLDKNANAGRSTHQQQLDSLRVLVQTFKGTDAGDVGIRAAALEKLGQIGRASDIEDILPLVRKPATSADLYNGLESVKSIMDRAGSPQLRGSKHLSADTRALLSKSHLTDAERARAIEDVMSHGEIASFKRHVGGNMNEVYFITYKDSIALADGTRAPIKAVFKPENTYVGKEKPFFTREVSAYELDRDFARTGMVPPTVEGILSRTQVPGVNRPNGVGSLQYMVPNSQPLGRSATKLDPKFKPFLESPGGKQQMSEIRTLLYTLNDPDKLPAKGGFPTPNYGNILAVPDKSAPGGYRLHLIDNGGGQGALGKKIDSEMLPDGSTNAGRNLGKASDDEMRRALEPLVGEHDAADIVRRSHEAAKKKRRRQRKAARRARRCTRVLLRAA